MPVKLTFDAVKKAFQDANCTLLEIRYQNAQTPMRFICSCGTKWQITWNNFQQGKRCAGCGRKKMAASISAAHKGRKRPGRRVPYSVVKACFDAADCTLLVSEEEYCGASQMMPYICSCGNQSRTSYSFFKSGRRCKQCGIAQVANAKRLSYEYVKAEFCKAGCTLLATEYLGDSMKMPYVCSCGNVSEISWHSFHMGHRCSECRGGVAYNLEYVSKAFKDHDCTLLATEYVNSQTNMPYICECGTESKITWARFRDGSRCKNCQVAAMRLDFDFVKSEFCKAGCTLLATEYINNMTNMPYICSCGRRAEICYGAFSVGHRCKECGKEKQATQQRLSIDFIREEFTKRGCTLLATEYINNMTPLAFICSCGRTWTTTWANFSRGQLCGGCKGERTAPKLRLCKGERTAPKLRLLIEEVVGRFADVGLVLLATKHSNHNELLPYRCNECGHESEASISNVSAGKGCPVCGSEKRSVARRHSYEYVQKFFTDNGCTLLSQTYNRNNDPLEFICRCGRTAIIQFANFRIRKECGQCGRDGAGALSWETRRFHEQLMAEADFDWLAQQLKERRAELGDNS